MDVASGNKKRIQGLPDLGYWKIRDLAQGIRYQLIYMGVEFNDMQFSLDQGSRASGKRPGSDWDRCKQSLGLEFPNLPYFIDGDVRITETLAIHEYVATKWDEDLVGKTPKDRAQVYMMANVVMELKKNVTGPQYESGEIEDVLACIPDQLPPILKFQGKNRYLCSNEKPTWVDFFFFEFIQSLRWVTDGIIFQQYPSLQVYYDDMSSLPNLKEHLLDKDAPEK